MTSDSINLSCFSCFIIGESTLPIRCAEILLECGHRIYGMIADDPNVIAWCREKNIPFINVRKKEIYVFLSSNPFDYLFSANGDIILDENILALPRRSAINYHDSLLPVFAGMYATSWALMNGETRHGISWHEMDVGIDTGAILKQVPVEVEPGDTAFSLNIKCYEAAVTAFSQLVVELATGQEKKQEQNLEERTFYGYYQRPVSGGVFCFDCEARKIEALVRALNFGPYPNPLGLPKIAMGKRFFIIKEISILDTRSELPPGTVKDIETGSLTVSTATNDIWIQRIYSIDGRKINIPDFIASYNIYNGWRFDKLDPDIAGRIEDINAVICRHEKFWVKRLSRLSPPKLPAIDCRGLDRTVNVNNNIQNNTHKSCKLKIPLPGGIRQRGEILPLPDLLLLFFAIYLCRLTNGFSFDIGYSDDSIREEIDGLSGIFSPQVPLHIELNPRNTIKELAETLRRELKRLRRRKTFMKDIIARYPVLETKAQLLEQTLAIGVTLVKRISDVESPMITPMTGKLNLAIPSIPENENEYCCMAVYSLSVINIDKFSGYFNEIVKNVMANEDIKLEDIRVSHRLLQSNLDIPLEDPEADDFGF